MAARIELVLTESDVSIVNNTSKVTAKLYYYGNGVSYSGYQKTWKITIDGTTYSGTNTFTTSTSAQLLGTVSKTVTHNDNGAKTVSVSASFATGVSIGTLTTSKSLTLTTIPRVSDIEVDKTSLFAGEDIIATATPKSSSFTDVITLSMGSHTATLTSGEAYTIPLNWLDAVPNAMKGTASVTVKTYNGSTLIGSKTVNVTVKVPASAVPSVDSIEITEGVSSVATNFGVFVKNLSQLLVETTATGIYGSTISSVKTTVDGITYAGAQFTSNIIRTAGSLTVTVNVTDSRGQTATGTATVTIEDYEKPYVNIEVQQSGTTATLTITGKVYAIDATGTAKNTKSLLLQYKKVTDAGYTEETLTVESWEFEITQNITIDESVTYEFIATVSDKINSTSAVTQTGIVVISRLAGGKGVTLFAEAEHEGFWVKDVDYTITSEEYTSLTALLAEIVVGGVRLIDWIYPVGHIITSSNPEFNPNLIYRTTTWERYAAGKTLVGVDDTDDEFNSAGKIGGEKTHQLIIDELPSHRHYLKYGKAFIGYQNSNASTSNGESLYKYNVARENALYGEDRGGNQPHNNMPPYITVYFWRRTA